MDKWQERWEGVDKGRETFVYFPDVRVRKRNRLTGANHYSTQVLSGHGNGNCTKCMVAYTAEHVMFQCPLYMEERAEMFMKLYTMGLFLGNRSSVMNDDVFKNGDQNW